MPALSAAGHSCPHSAAQCEHRPHPLLVGSGGIPGGRFGETLGCLVRCVHCSPLVAQLYELDGDPRRKEFLDDLFSFMQKRGEPPPAHPHPALSMGFIFSCVIVTQG